MAASRMAWRRKERSTGLYGMVHNHSRGWELRYGGVAVASVDISRAPAGYYWVARCTDPHVPLRNSAAEGRTYTILESAKDAAEVYVRECLGLKPKKVK